MRRTKINAELLNDENNDLVPDIRKAEVQYKDDEAFVDEGVSIEPFNLDKEREDGYFDENGNYVEYIDQNEIKDAWLDSVDVYEKYTGKTSIPESNDARDLTTDELAAVNRRISDVLEPGETVLRGLRRLKGTSTDKKLKMSAETKQLFDQLTDDAAKLMDNGDYNVYEEKQESFQREAEGYEKLAAARNNGVSGDLGREKSDDLFDMFVDDDGTAVAENSASAGSASVSVQSYESGALQNDYVYDESSGYYYSSSSGYYYDPSSGYYCSAASGKWYSYIEESGTYEEIPQETDVITES
ncbi:uncharacterized protein [Henckelia pumila]